jgi:hypothetical protein
MAIKNSRPSVPPAKDEWGVYDPQKAGIPALFARLDARASRIAPPVAAGPSLRKDIPEPAKAPIAPARPTLRDAK